jgi:putative ABC transport system ATP-binding protein
MLELQDVTLVRDGRRVLDGVSAVFGHGVCTAVAGRSGSGKSTLLRLFDRLEEPDSGRVLLHGRPVEDYDVREVRRRVGLVQQVPVVLGSTVLEDVRTGRRVDEAAVAALLERAGLPGLDLGRDTGSLSGGEAQRLALARALAVEPEVLLLDEPTSALDATAAAAVEDVVHRLVEEGLTAVLVSHDREQTRRLATSVVVLEAGRVVETGPVGSVRYLTAGAAS